MSFGCLTFTQVYKAGLYGDRYAYIAVGWYTTKSWVDVPQDVDCSSAQIREAMAYVITVGNLGLGELDATSVSGMTSVQLEDVLKTRLAGQLFIGRRARNAYDAVWSVALALNETETVLEQSGEHRTRPGIPSTTVRSRRGWQCGLMVGTQLRQSEGSGFKFRSGQIAYFHSVKTRLSTLGTGDVPRGSDST